MDAKELSTLVSEGWMRQTLAEEPRLTEIVELYKEIGMEVLVIPAAQLPPEELAEGGCSQCLTGSFDPDRYKVVFTRPGKTGLTIARKGKV